MDPIKEEKIQAKNEYRKNNQFLYSLILHLLAGLACSVFFSFPFWFPSSICSSMKHFLLISLPCIWSSFFNPKCLFVVVNVIVIFLVGESRLVGTNSSPARDIYNEYTERSRSLRGVSVSTPHQEKMRQEKRVEEAEKEAELKVVNPAEDKEVQEEDEELAEVKEVIKLAEKDENEVNQEGRIVQETPEIVGEEACEEKERHIVEEDAGLPAEELNKRVEEFIARVNKQRWLEAQLMVSCSA